MNNENTPAVVDTAQSGPLAPGLHDNIPSTAYHADPCETPSLSSGMARALLAKSPAHVALECPRLGGTKRESTAAMDTGSLIHALLAGESDSFDVGDFPNYKSKAAQEWRDSVYDSGKTPVLRDAYDAALVVVSKVRERAAEGLTDSPFDGCARHEVTAIWQEGTAYCRARYDVLSVDEHKNATVWDWKSTSDITDRGIERTIAKHRYDIQDAFYLRGLEMLGYKVPQLSFVFVFFETEPPYTVRRVVLSNEYLAQARKEVSQAIDLWKACLASGRFDPLPADTLTVEIPHYLSENDGEITIE